MITVRLQRNHGIEGVYPISVYTSTDRHKERAEIALLREVVEFLSTHFEFVESNEEVIFDVYAKELNKYVAECVNDIVYDYEHDTSMSMQPRRTMHSDFHCEDLINEMTVISGLIHLPGEERETLSALIKLYFTDRDIVIVER